MMRVPPRSRPGIALVAALSLLALLGLLTAGAVAATASAQRSARLAVTEGRSSSEADFALASVLADPAGFGLADLPLGRSVTLAVPLQEVGTSVAVSATRLANGLLWIVADASVAGVDQGHRRIGLVARFASLGALPAAGIVARGAVNADGVTFSADSSGDADCARGASGHWSVSTDSAAFYLTANQTAALDSAPSVLHVRGDTAIAGGAFAGILVVDGSLAVTGSWSVVGLVVVRGSVRSTGTVAVTGGLTAFASGTSVDIAAGSVRYAPCVIAQAIRTAFPPRAVPGRAWAELF